MVWREQAGPQAIALFARMMGAPGDRNLINFGINAGITFKAPLPGRDDDVFGVGFGFAKVSGGAAASISDRQFFSGTFLPCGRRRPSSRSLTSSRRPAGGRCSRTSSTLHTGRRHAKPQRSVKSVGNAAVFGMRSVVTF